MKSIKCRQLTNCYPWHSLVVSMHAYDPLDPGSNLGGGDSCFLFLMSKESDSKSHYIGIITFYLGLYSFIILWSSAVSAVKVNLGN